MPIATAQDARAILVERWPHLFKTHSQPLALGIADAIERELCVAGDELRMLHRALGKHCAAIPYLTALSNGAVRMGLDGTTEPPTQMHRDNARRQLQARTAARSRKRAKATASKPQPASPAQSKAAPLVLVKKRRIIKGAP